MVNVRRVEAKSLLSPTQIGGDYAVNPYRGCPHKCIYCYAACINHTKEEREEEWGDYIDVKEQKSAINLAKIFRKRILF
ncbi:MAG: radical SAM protein, partial [Synergistaceae bacterium]|nr:radical SAM protein [Synergistaceae bacterium]